jgi:hypothetical protein
LGAVPYDQILQQCLIHINVLSSTDSLLTKELHDFQSCETIMSPTEFGTINDRAGRNQVQFT